MLILTRKEKEVLQFGEHLYLELGKRNKQGNIRCTLYNRKNDEEFVRYLNRNEQMYLNMNNEKITVQLLHFKSSSMYNLGIEAPNHVKVSRVDSIKYLTDEESLQLENETYFDDETVRNTSYIKDELIDRYKEDLSWFFN